MDREAMRTMTVRVTDDAGTEVAAWPVDVTRSGEDGRDGRRAVYEVVMGHLMDDTVNPPAATGDSVVYERISQTARRIRKKPDPSH